MSKDEQARARLVEIALDDEFMWRSLKDPTHMSLIRQVIRKSAGFKDTTAGSWSAAGLTDAMDRAGLVVPAPGTEARHRSIALLDWLYGPLLGPSNAAVFVVACGFHDKPDDLLSLLPPEPGNIIAWLQHPIPPGMLQSPAAYQEAAGWRRGHVAVIVAVDDESLTTVGWGEGPKPGRVMMRRLWRDAKRDCDCMGYGMYGGAICECRGTGTVPRSSTVLWRRAGGLYGVARPVAR
jgi:hypothetical protein